MQTVGYNIYTAQNEKHKKPSWFVYEDGKQDGTLSKSYSVEVYDISSF